MSDFVELSGCIIDRNKVVAIVLPEKDSDSVMLLFDGGVKLFFSGSEAREVWKLFAEKSWQSDDGVI